MWPNQQDFSKIPMGAGKTKMLWDAIRTAGVGPDGGPLPPGDPSENAPPMGPANPVPPRPVPAAGPPSVETPAGPVAAPPPASDALPSDARVGALQSQIDAGNQKPSLVQSLKRALPSLLVSGVGAALGAPAVAQGANAATQTQISERDKQRAGLIQQADSAQTTRASEYAALQRAGAMRDVAGTNVGGRMAVADTNAKAKTDVAGTVADTKLATTDSTNANRLDVQGLKNKGSYATAIVGANGRIQSAKYAADAARSRQQAGFDHSDAHQQAGFTHTDEKPTADEDRRADLSSSLDVLADRLQDISTRRPELFGKVAGRMTKGRMALGTSDPDVAELKSIQENLGQISLGAHAMRNAGHIATAADAMANIYNSPEAYRAGLAAGKGSADTMQHITRPTLTKPKASAGTAKPDPLGIR